MPPITSQRIDAYNQLNRFMQFAKADGRGGDEIVHLDAPSGKLSVDGNDRIKRAGNLWSAPHRDVAANNSTRGTFKDLLLKLFDKQSLDELPPSVRDVLKMDDFDGTGKPLSARRIKAVMAAVVETDDYQKTSAYAALAGFADAKLGVADGDTAETLRRKAVDFCANLTTSGTRGGGNLNNVLGEIGGNLDTDGMKKDAALFFIGIQGALMSDGAFRCATYKVIGQGQFSNLPETEKITVARSDSVIKDMDDFFAAWKTQAEARFRDANKDADPPTVEAALRAITKEIQKLVDRLKIQMVTLECQDGMPGATEAEKIRNFTTLAKLIRKGDKNISAAALVDKARQLAPMLFFGVDRSRLAQAKTDLAQFLRQALADAKAKGTQLNHVTGVNALALREFNKKPITVNGELIPEVNPRVLEEVVSVDGVSGDELTPAVWKCENTGVPATTSDKPVGVHKALCKAIPDRRMRAFVSTMLSMSLGIKGFFDSQVDKNGGDGDTLGLFGGGRVGSHPLSENQVIVLPLQGRNSMDSYEVMTNDRGDVTVVAKFSVGMQAAAGVGELGEVYSKSTFEVTINLKNEFDGQGLPAMEILDIDVK